VGRSPCWSRKSCSRLRPRAKRVRSRARSRSRAWEARQASRARTRSRHRSQSRRAAPPEAPTFEYCGYFAHVATVPGNQPCSASGAGWVGPVVSTVGAETFSADWWEWPALQSGQKRACRYVNSGDLGDQLLAEVDYTVPAAPTPAPVSVPTPSTPSVPGSVPTPTTGGGVVRDYDCAISAIRTTRSATCCQAIRIGSMRTTTESRAKSYHVVP
jgi:hypothetical protein